MTFDPTKPVQTRDGRPARILCTDYDNGQYPIVGIVRMADGRSSLRTFTRNGTAVVGLRKETDNDLVNVPTQEEKYYICYSHRTDDRTQVLLSSSDEEAARKACRSYNGGFDGREWNAVRILKIIFENGIPVKTELLEI